MSLQRPGWWPQYGDPVYCPIRSCACVRFHCVTSAGITCEERNALALVPMQNAEPGEERLVNTNQGKE